MFSLTVHILSKRYRRNYTDMNKTRIIYVNSARFEICMNELSESHLFITATEFI
jgi:hypothetical protein